MSGELAHVRAVLFDFDDTLAGTNQARVAALQRVFDEVGIREPTAADFWASIHGRTYDGPLADLRERLGLDADLTQRYPRAYWLHEAANLRRYDGIAGVVARVAASGRALGVVTTKRRRFLLDGRPCGVDDQLRLLGLERFFDVVVGFEDVARTKPDPEGVLLALERLGAAPADAVMVGDTTADFGAGRGAGVTVCRAAWGGESTGPAIPGAIPHYTLRRPGELLDLLGVAGG